MSHDGQTRAHESKKVLHHLQSQLGADMRLLEILGADGAELLVRVRDLDRDRDVVLKILAVDRALVPEAYQHFENEVAAAAQLLHPNIAAVQPIERRGALVYYELDLGSARTLESLLRTPRAPSLEPARRILRDVAAALDYAHERGVVHGALSPTAIFIGEDGAARVSGFGLTGAPRATERSSAPAYMAPEQWHGEAAVGERADQYALGVIAYELITGQRRTTSVGAGGLITVDPLPLAIDRPLGSGIPVAATAAILRAMAKRPTSRFESSLEFVAALFGRPITPVQSLPTQRPSVADDQRNRVALLPVAAVVLLGVILGGLAVPSVRQAFTASIFREESRPEVVLQAARSSVPSSSPSGGGGGAEPSQPGSSSGPGPLGSPAATITADAGLPVRVVVPTPNGAATTVSNANRTTSLSAPSSGASPAPPTAAPGTAIPPSRRSALVRVTLSEGSATVLIDGMPRGSTPLAAALTPGEHTVSLVGPGSYIPAQIMISVSPGDIRVAGFFVAPVPPR